MLHKKLHYNSLSIIEDNIRKILEFEKEEAYTANQALKVIELAVVKDMG